MRLDERGEDGDTVGRIGCALHDDGRVTVHREREGGRETFASLDRRVRATVLVDRYRRGEIRKSDIEVLLAIITGDP